MGGGSSSNRIDIYVHMVLLMLWPIYFMIYERILSFGPIFGVVSSFFNDFVRGGTLYHRGLTLILVDSFTFFRI